MCEENISDDVSNMTSNPLTMKNIDFTAWLSARGIDVIGTPPPGLVTRAVLLFEMVREGKISTEEVGMYLHELGLMVPIVEN